MMMGVSVVVFVLCITGELAILALGGVTDKSLHMALEELTGVASKSIMTTS